MVERNLAKVDVVGSNPIIRSQNKNGASSDVPFLFCKHYMDSNPRRVGKLQVSEQLADTPSRHLCEGTRPQVGRGGAGNTSFEFRVTSAELRVSRCKILGF